MLSILCYKYQNHANCCFYNRKIQQDDVPIVVIDWIDGNLIEYLFIAISLTGLIDNLIFKVNRLSCMKEQLKLCFSILREGYLQNSTAALEVFVLAVKIEKLCLPQVESLQKGSPDIF